MNTNENTTIIYLKYAVWSCLYLILLTPLLLSSKFIFPFISLKAFYFRIAVEAAIFLYVMLALANSYYKPKMNSLVWTIFGFGLIIFITGLFGVNPYKSFWGTIERAEGFLTISHLIAYFFILSQMIKTKRDWLNFLSAHIFISLLVGIYAIAQRLGASWTIHAGEDRLSSTLGNAAYLGGYMLGNFWLCLLLFFEKKQCWWKTIFALIGIFEIYILFQTQTRGAMLAFVISLILFSAIGLIFSKHKKTKKISLAIIAILMLISAFIFINRDKPWINEHGPVHRLLNISTKGITAESRILAWSSSWRGWQDRFLFGYGWENYNVAFNKYFEPEIYRDNGSQVWFDRAHNTVFDVAVASGIIGLLAYLSIFGIALYILFKKIKSKQATLTGLALFMFFIGHFLQNIFVFDCMATYIMLFTVLGATAHMANLPSTQHKIEIKNINAYALAIGLIALAATIYSFNVKPAQANRIGLEAMKHFYQKNIPQAAQEFEQAIQMNTYQSPELRQKFAENIISIYGSSANIKTDQDKKTLEQAIAGIKQNINDEPLETRNYLYLMALYNNFYSIDKSKLMQALDYGKQAIRLSPTRQQTYFELGRTYLALGQQDKGIASFEKAVELNPKAIDSYWNLLSAYVITKQMDKAETVYQYMRQKGATDSHNNLEKLSRIYGTIKYYPKLKEIYQKLIESDPQNIDYWMRLAIIHKEMGDYDTARTTALRIKSINPKAGQQVDDFLKTLK
ncbi:MAG: O-antigen ligase family protein [Candidatus Kuenenbacteria bacterium]